jgi:pimeloyl-ACP methyl ester carboxylesterase
MDLGTDFGLLPLTNEQVESTDASCLVDQIFPGQPLIISFGFVSWESPPKFDFFGRLKKLDQALGIQSNRILLRDLTNSWYHRGIPGLGTHVDEVAESLKVLIRKINPSRVTFIGQSMGAYVAIMFGLLLQADAIVAFGPLSFLNTQEAALYHERRWFSVMQALEQNPPASGYYNLRELCLSAQNSTKLDIFIGTKPDGGTESVNLDAMHAYRLNVSSQTQVHPYPESGHAVVHYLIDQHRQIDSLMAKYVFNHTLTLPFPAEWKAWIQENISIGVLPQEIIKILITHGFSEEQSAEEVQKVVLSYFRVNHE